MTWLLGKWAIARTFLGAFKGPCLLLAGVAVLAGGFAGWKVASWRGAGALQAAEARLAAYQAGVAAQTAQGIADAVAAERAAYAALEARRAAITTELQTGNAQLLTAIRGFQHDFRTTLADPRFDCLRLPLPDAALEQLRRPGGTAAP